MRLKALTWLCALALCLALGACGGGEDGSPTQTTTQGAGSGQAQADGVPGSGDDAGSAEESGSPARSGDAGPESSQGDVSPQSTGFQRRNPKGVMRFLPAYGEEASARQRSAAQAVLSAYLKAVANDDWQAACAHLSAQGRREVYAVRAQQRPAVRPPGDCASTVAWWAEVAVLPSTEFPDFATPQIVSLREEGERAFALLHGSDGEDYWEDLRREGGEWKVYTLAPQPFGP